MKVTLLTTTTVVMLSSMSSVCGFSRWSGFTNSFRPSERTSARMSSNLVMYEFNKDPPSSSGNNANMWSVLANTEKWLSNILGDPKKADNPYSRKEVTYICDLSDEDALVVAGIWRRLREARELGTMHSDAQKEFMEQKDYQPATFRQTQVIVIPNDDNLSQSFHNFDAIVTQINQCRRNARDFILDLNLEKLHEQLADEESQSKDWSISVNCAHLHPKFGELTKAQELKELKEEEASGEPIDVNLQMYKEKRLLARRSPYPTVCVEVRAMPPMDFTPPKESVNEANKVSLSEVQKLEALFGKTASFAHPTSASEEDEQKKSPEDSENAFYDAIADTDGIQEISLVSPLFMAQDWISKNHKAFDITTSTFGTTECQHVDEAYEFVFNNIAMLQAAAADNNNNNDNACYLVFSDFMTSSATSFEKFAQQGVLELVNILSLQSKTLDISTLHPEHVLLDKRAPVPTMVLEWKNNNDTEYE